MYLKSIELHGFKSFAERIKLNFSPGITAIVGPNGCGKSNIVDAFRWCLGEQSAHSLRSNQMLDVIFNGSQSRSGSGYAEVILTFDNTDNRFSLDYPEIEVTRKLFRSGESEYYINKVQCRLKDIRDMFLDTGIGTEGYSIFAQGKVESIIMAKPEERKGLFEETAGVSKYKYRREETLRKLDRVHQDMERVNDMNAILKEQINALESAVRKARLFNKYKEELRNLEIAYILKKIGTIETEMGQLKSVIEEQEKEKVELSNQIDLIDAEISKLRVSIDEFDRELFDIQTELNDVDTKIARCEEKKERAKENIQLCITREEELNKEIEESKIFIDRIKEKIEALVRELEELKIKISELRPVVDSRKEKLEDLRAKINQQEKEKENLTSQIYNIFSSRNEKTKLLNNLESRIIHEQAEIKLNQKDILKIEEKSNIIKKEQEESLRELQRLKEEYDNSKISFEEVKKQYQEINSKLEEMRNKQGGIKELYIELDTKIKTVRDMINSDPKYISICAVLENNFPGIHGTVKSLIKISPYHADIVSSAFGDKLNYIVAETVESALSVINYLKENGLGKITFVILEKIQSINIREQIFNLKGEKPLISLLSFDSKWDKLINFLIGNYYFSENNIYSDGLITGGGDAQDIINLELKIPELENRKSKCEEELISITKEIFQLENKLKEIEEKKNQLEKVFTESENRYNEYYKNIKEKEELIKLNFQECEIINKNICEIKERIEKEYKEIEELKNSITEDELKEKELKSLLPGYEEKIKELREQEKIALEEFSTVNRDLYVYIEREKHLSKEVENKKTDLKQNELKIEKSTKEIANLKEKIKQQKENLEKEDNEMNKLFELKNHLDEKIKRVNKEKAPVFSKIQEKQTILHQLKEKFDEVSSLLHSSQIKFGTKEFERNSFYEKLKEFNIDIEQAKQNYSDIQASEEEIIKLKKRIDSMGAVNMTADEEYTALQQRYEWVRNQQEDLLKAEQDLRDAINKINATIKENFMETFTKVRENFKNLINQLFEGGESDLILTDENNILESGIEIMVQPPGKKLQNISLLSGGEKAMTAIALLFAFFMVRPSPVCILDECDAPLDEANIVRYINLIKSFSDKTQFLIITHNRRTIEVADVIYGVTMEEFGVSKIYSLQLVSNQAQSPEKEVNETVPA